MRKMVLHVLLLTFAVPGMAIAGHHWDRFDETFDIVSDELHVDIDIDYGEIDLRSSGSRGTCRVSVEYDREFYDLDVRYDREEDILRIEVNRDDWPFNDSHGDHDFAGIVIELPEEPVLDIETDIRAGDIDFKLGGLTIARFDFDAAAGETRIDFDRPNRMEMDELSLHLMVGESNVLNLGNARFREAFINSGIGELTVDFNGLYSDRCEACLDLDIGQTTVIIPEDLGVRLRYSKFLFLTSVQLEGDFDRHGSWFYYGDYRNDDRRSLTMDISNGIGELRVEVR